MARTTEAHVDVAGRLLAQERVGGASAEDHAAAAARVYEKLFNRLAPLIGAAGVQALFARSVKVSRVKFPCLARLPAVGGSADGNAEVRQLARCLSTLEPETASAVAIGLYANLIALLTTFIGAGLVSKVLDSAFPSIDETVPEERES